MEKKKFKLGLVPKLIIAIIIGILFGQFLPTGFCRFVNTVWILQYLLKIHHSTDDPCLCNYGNR